MIAMFLGVTMLVQSCAKDGKDGEPGKHGDKGDKGDPGDDAVITISDDGYWIINGMKTNIKAEGIQGNPGATPLITISDDGYWVINGDKTNVKAEATQGVPGVNGKNSYLVIFDSDGGKPLFTVTGVLDGEKVSPPANPIKDGLIFNGWYFGEEEFDFDEPVTTNITLSANWTQWEGLLESINKQIVYEYDSQNRITRYGYVKLYYNAAGDLEKYHWFQIRSGKDITFSNNGNKIIFNYISYPYSAAQAVEITADGEIELNDQGLPVKMTSEFVQYHEKYTNGIISITNWSYTATLTWQNENLTKLEWEREDEQGSSAGTKTFTHDDKKTPFYHCNVPKWALWCLSPDWIYAYYVYYGHDDKYVYNGYNENNIKTETWEEDGTAITYEYTYNDYGFPVTRTWVDGTNTYTETYTYKQE